MFYKSQARPEARNGAAEKKRHDLLLRPQYIEYSPPALYLLIIAIYYNTHKESTMSNADEIGLSENDVLCGRGGGEQLCCRVTSGQDTF